jgi:hypothetical protein
MIQQGTISQARALAEQRWAGQFSFDLAPETWDVLFEEFRPAEVITAIAKMKGTFDQRPERVYARFLQMLDGIASQR